MGAEGSQVFLSYGAFSNREHVLFYGYFADDNPYDTGTLCAPSASPPALAPLASHARRHHQLL